MLLRNSSASLWYRFKMVKAKPFSAFLVHPWAISEPILRKTCDDSLVYVW
jgi:hypothetical protein